MFKRCGGILLLLSALTLGAIGPYTLTQSMLPFLSTGSTFRLETRVLGALYPSNRTFTFAHYRLGLNQVISQNLLTAEPTLIGGILPYPSPARNDNIVLAYMLSGAMDIEVRIYSLLGREVKRTQATKNTMGGLRGYNKFPIRLTANNGSELSNGIYFIVLFDAAKNQSIAKTKLAISR